MRRDGIAFAKMSGAGNDFLVFDEADAKLLPAAPEFWAPRVCRRRLSVGGDGVVLVGRAAGGDLHVRFFNPDGSEAFCGNGTRCAVRFAVLRGMLPASGRVQTLAGTVSASADAARVVLELPAPVVVAAFRSVVDGDDLKGTLVDAGCPHAVLEVADVADAPLERWGPALRRLPEFGDAGANVDVIAGDGVDRVSIRTWERGVEGETLCCGSGAIAAALVRRSAGGPRRTTVVPRSGIPVVVELDGPHNAPDRVRLEGDARLIFEGRLSTEALEDYS